MVTAGLDLVAVEIDDEGTVVIRVVVRAQARLAVILAAGLQGRGVESVDIGAAFRAEADMRAALGIGAAVDPLFRKADPEARMVAADLAIAWVTMPSPGTSTVKMQAQPIVASTSS